MKIKWHIYYVDYSDEKKERIIRRYNVRSHRESFSADWSFAKREHWTKKKSWELWEIVGSGVEDELIIENNQLIAKIGIWIAWI